MTQFKIHSSGYRLFITMVGIVATIVYRLIIFLNRLPTPYWSDVAWYIGTFGFIWYFAHRYRIERTRDQIIAERNLADKIAKQKQLSVDDREVLIRVLKSLSSSKARWNYIVIFVSSGLAIIFDIIVRLMK